MQNDLIKELTEFYDEIYKDGICPSYHSCKRACEHSLNFYRGRIGEKYGRNIPKIFVVGQEPVFPKNYSGKEIVFNVEEPCTMSDAEYNDHYLRTFYTVAKLLLSEENIPKSYFIKDMADEKYEELRHSFFMTNYYKCVFTDDIKRSNKNPSTEMEKNCAGILIKEINKLKPDIVIIQGKNHKTFWKNISYKVVDGPVVDVVRYNESSKKYEQGLYIAETKSHCFYIIDSYHPTSHGIWTNEKVFATFNNLLNKALQCEKQNK